jgi:hypothetical protein
MYKGRPNEENPYFRSDFARYCLDNPAKDNPFFIMYPIKSAHLSEMGWPAFPKFLRAMIDTKRPFVYNWKVKHRPSILCRQSLPAFGNCTLDRNPGNGDLAQGETYDAPINSWLTWYTEDIVDEKDKWEMTIELDNSAPLGECTVDLTPRKCQKFRPKPGTSFTWTNTAGGKEIGSGAAQADTYSLVTIRQLRVVKGKNRITVKP